MTKVLANDTAPAFTLRDVSGQTVSLGDALKRGPVVAAFLKVSCPVCQFTFPFLERLHQAYGKHGATVLGISQDDARDTKDFWKEYGLTFPALVDGDGYPVSNEYGLTNVPTVMLIAPDGGVKVSGHGFSRDDLEKMSAELARHTGLPPAALWRKGEAIPDYKPG